ncbi:MAG: HAMP domain-containing histidine kinase [Phycisphaeraceae bacterium]|nr:HAMP domain-containing histidine kinase [Phycisphaeraceae bacterium]
MADTNPINPADPEAQLDKLQGEIDRLRKDLDKSRQLAILGVAAGMIAHELNNVLTPVLGYAKAALARPQDTDLVRKALERSADAAERAGRITSTVLALARGDARSGGWCDAHACVEAAIECLGCDLAQEGIEMIVNVPRGTLVAMAATSLEHVMLNLILNAKAAMAPGGGRCEVAVVPSPTPETHLVLEVTDTGKGIPSDVRDRLFQPFASCGGTGLGLAGCRGMVEAGGGAIRAEEGAGGGTRVVLDLPRVAGRPMATARCA